MKSTFILPKRKQRHKLPRVNTLIIGAGPAGLSAATTLAEHGKKVVILERELIPGGKCHTYSDPHNVGNKTEWGAALLAPNYGKVIDQVMKRNLSWESTLKSDITSLPFMQELSQMTVVEKTSYSGEFIQQMLEFSKHAKKYQSLRDNRQALPEDYSLPFATFAAKYQLEHINDFSYVFVPAFGYGLMEDCPTYSVLAYYGATTIPAVVGGVITGKTTLVSIKNGFQSLMQAVANDHDIKYGVNIESIERNDDGVLVNYVSNNERYAIYADSLVLAISPAHWSSLGMKLSDIEQKCIDNLTYYQYPVAIVKLKGYPAKHYFDYNGLIKSGVGHLALITTRDNRINPQDGRLCTAYINLDPRNPNDTTTWNDFTFTEDKVDQLRAELSNLPGVTGVEIIETKVWPDYMSTLPWDLRLELDSYQMNAHTKTAYVGPYVLGGFEDVACVWEVADKVVTDYINKSKNLNDSNSYYSELRRATFFYTAKRLPPFNDNDETFNEKLRLASR